MSFVSDQTRRIDSQLDTLGLPLSVSHHLDHHQAPSSGSLSQINSLRTLIKSLSTSSSSKAILKINNVLFLLDQAHLSPVPNDIESGGQLDELEWLLVAKAAVQTYGIILNTLLYEIIPLSNDIWYWDDVLGSYSYTTLYSLQTSPIRLWDWSSDIYHDALSRFKSVQDGGDASGPDNKAKSTQSKTLAQRWSRFYRLVRDSVRDRSLLDLQKKALSPFALARAHASRKQASLRKLREMSASGLGLLMNECLSFDLDDDGSIVTKFSSINESLEGLEEWKLVVAKSVALMETVLQNVTSLDTGITDFEENVFAAVEDDPEIIYSNSDSSNTINHFRPAFLSNRLRKILQAHIPDHKKASKSLALEYGKPSLLVRYWLPATALLLSSSTLLRLVANRKVAISAWIQDASHTSIDFWNNWIVEPIKKIIGTIRHDKASEIAIMSKESLQGDRASLERMVVDFAVDNPAAADAAGRTLSESEISQIRAKIKEGDLTPVLRAYEKDLRSPFRGAITGDLIRALLIQVQKTKVDVEVAVGGIDALLKSQELVFGFVGLTPSLLICFGLFRWTSRLLGSQKGRKRKQSQMIRALRNIDRILAASNALDGDLLSYREHGLLLCEVHILRERARIFVPGQIYRDLLEEISDLENIRTGVKRQLQVVERIRWAYAKWII
ncbi:MAG: Nuclear control of ATPase protein 2 [Trizodia sp. TS-e1964]|nr:MAG: Nuclear control of ATPase protein 2 [Trizodia sp. TS-e1964]